VFISSGMSELKEIPPSECCSHALKLLGLWLEIVLVLVLVLRYGHGA